MDPLLTPSEAAELLQVDPRTLETWRYRKQGPPYTKVGGRIRYSKADLDDYLDKRTVQA